MAGKMHLRFLSLVLLFSLQGKVLSENVLDFLKGFVAYKDCFHQKDPGLCLKERTLDALNQTMLDDRPITIGFIEIQKNQDYFSNATENEVLPEEATERSAKLNDVLMEKIDDFLKSRTVKLNLSNAFEGRKGGGGGGKKGGNMAMMAAAGMCAMMAQMVMGKMMLMAGSAMMMAKISLMLSLIMMIKKMQGGGGGEEKHIVYADSGHSHGGGGGGYGGGGWHRSLEDPHNVVYKGQWTASSDNNSDDHLIFRLKKIEQVS